jgi:maltooligosyltrehalose trehalohydrolase
VSDDDVWRVWAPHAATVEVEIAGERHPMKPAGGGWWAAAIEAGPDADYGFAIDGGPARPDPRSPRQPHGVHGLSRRVNHDAFPWSDLDWQPPPLSSAIVYELHVGTFTPEGTFEAAAHRLDHLIELGVTHVEIMPVNAFPGRHGWGYDGVGLYAPHEPYGGPEGLKTFVDAAHARNLAVVLDCVYNHLGPDGNYLREFGPYFTDRYHTPWGEAVNLDGPGADEVRRFFVDNALTWLRDYHVDALRLDAVHAFYDRSAVHFLEELARAVDDLEAHLGRHKALIAESALNDPRVVRSHDAGGFGMDAQWSDDFHHALHALLTGERNGYYEDFGKVEHLARALERGYAYDGQYAPFFGRRHGAPAVGLGGPLPGHRFLGFLQNHDQVGNRARGERTSQLVDLRRVKLGAALVLTAPFVPLLFQGEEWGASTPFQYFTDHEDPKLGRLVSEGRRREFAAFGWDPKDIPDPQDPATFERSKLNWGEIGQAPHAGLLDWHRHLIRLRRSHPELTDGRLDRTRVRFDEAQRWLCLERGPITVACNFADLPRDVPLGPDRPTALLLGADRDLRLAGDRLHLPPATVAILGPAR